MSDDLKRIKTLLSSRYVGKAGVHAIGARPTAGTISVYVAPGSRKRYKRILQHLKKEAEPFEVVFTEEEPPEAAT